MQWLLKTKMVVINNHKVKTRWFPGYQKGS